MLKKKPFPFSNNAQLESNILEKSFFFLSVRSTIENYPEIINQTGEIYASIIRILLALQSKFYGVISLFTIYLYRQSIGEVQDKSSKVEYLIIFMCKGLEVYSLILWTHNCKRPIYQIRNTRQNQFLQAVSIYDLQARLA